MPPDPERLTRLLIAILAAELAMQLIVENLGIRERLAGLEAEIEEDLRFWAQVRSDAG
jgi:hypothetical protein